MSNLNTDYKIIFGFIDSYDNTDYADHQKHDFLGIKSFDFLETKKPNLLESIERAKKVDNYSFEAGSYFMEDEKIRVCFYLEKK